MPRPPASSKPASSKPASAKTAGAKAEPPIPQRTARGLLAVGAMASKVTKPILGKAGLAEGDIIEHWQEIVGPTLAASTSPERIRFPKGRREAGELTVRVSAGAFARTLQHETPRVLERVNAFFGYRAVERLKVVQGAIPHHKRPAPPPEPILTARDSEVLAEQLADITDPALRESFERLGRAVFGRR